MKRVLSPATLNLVTVSKFTIIPCRTKYAKYEHNHCANLKFRRERARKVWKIELPDFDKMRKDSAGNPSPDEIRSKIKEKGVAPPNIWNEREVYNPCTIGLIEPYKVTEDGKSSSLITSLKSPIASGKDLVKNRRALNEIKNYEGEDFDLEDFKQVASKVYISAHEALANKDNDRIFDYVTEHCFPVMTAGLRYHTIDWKYLGEIEPPSAVQVRVADLMAKSNKYAQITMKFHTKQILAIYDRHGRLVHGSPTNVKEVLEYIVLEKYLSNEYGLWRIHDRVKIDNQVQDVPISLPKTFVIENATS